MCNCLVYHRNHFGSRYLLRLPIAAMAPKPRAMKIRKAAAAPKAMKAPARKPAAGLKAINGRRDASLPAATRDNSQVDVDGDVIMAESDAELKAGDPLIASSSDSEGVNRVAWMQSQARHPKRKFFEQMERTFAANIGPSASGTDEEMFMGSDGDAAAQCAEAALRRRADEKALVHVGERHAPYIVTCGVIILKILQK